MKKETATLIPISNSQKFEEALNRLKNAPANCNEKHELTIACCKNCSRNINCEDCYIQTIGDLADPYRKAIQEKTNIGMYGGGMYQDKSGKYHYTHPHGSA